MALTLDIGANTRAAAKQIKDLGDNLGDVVDALDDVGDKAKGSGDRLERALKDAEDQAKKTSRSVDEVGSEGFGRASHASGEFKQEALQNLSEVTSSFDGSMSSIGDLVQGTLGGIASSIPGIGLAGAAAAVGVGALTAAFQASDEAAKESAERASEWADKFIESSGRVLDESIILNGVQDIIKDTTGKYAEAQEIARVSGVGLSEVLRALAGDQTNLASVQDAMVGATERANAGLAAQEQQTTSAAGEVFDYADAVNRANSALTAQTGEMDRGAAAAAAYQGAVAAGRGETVEFTNAVNGIPQIRETTVRINVDSSAYDRWQPAQKTAYVNMQNGRNFWDG